MLGFGTPRRLPREARLRHRHAEGLEQAVERAGHGSPPRPVSGYGHLQVRRLLTDGAGTLYVGGPGRLRLQALATLVALEPRPL